MRKLDRRFVLAAAAARHLGAGPGPGHAAARDFPTKPIKVVVPSPAAARPT